MPRDWTPREGRLVAEWVALNYPQAELRFRVDLGDLKPAMDATGLTAAELRRVGRSRRWVDAIAIEPGAVHLIEGKIRLSPGALEQLGLYKILFPLTPELERYRDRDLRLHLVMAVEDRALTRLARERGVEVHLYHPPWVDEYLALLDVRARRSPPPRGLPTGSPQEGESE